MLVVHEADQFVTPGGGGPKVKLDEVVFSIETSTIVACLCR